MRKKGGSIKREGEGRAKNGRELERETGRRID